MENTNRIIRVRIVIPFLITVITINGLAQKKSNLEAVYQLQQDYAIITGHVDSLSAYTEDSIYSPQSREDFRCQGTYEIPDSLLLTIHPFDVDSIVVYCPENPDNCSVGMKRLQKMSKREIAIFTDMLYNYDFLVYMEAYTYGIELYKLNRPDIKLFFYDQQKRNTLSIYLFDDEMLIRYESTFNDDKENIYMYWGAACDDLKIKMISFFSDNYGYQIKECIPELMPPYIPIPIDITHYIIECIEVNFTEYGLEYVKDRTSDGNTDEYTFSFLSLKRIKLSLLKSSFDSEEKAIQKIREIMRKRRKNLQSKYSISYFV